MTDLAPAEQRLEDERLKFCALVKQGVPEMEAAVSVGWTRVKLKRELRDPTFAELVAVSELQRDGAVEKIAYEMATIRRDKDMVKWWLNNRQPDRWADRRQVDISGSVQVPVHITLGVRDGIRALLEDDPAQIAALMPGGALDVIEATVVED